MTVLCPSCFTRYRHEPAAPAALALAECSRCDERFPLREARRSYVLLPPAGSAVPQRALPAIAAVPDRLAAGAVRAASVTHTVPFGSDPLTAGVTAADGEARPRELADFDLPTCAAAPAPARSAVVEFLIAVVPPSIGASVAYYFASRDQLDPVAWSALGGAAGFLLGWGCLLWIRRKD